MKSLSGLKMGSKLDMAKLFLVCHPTERKASVIATIIGCNEWTVWKALNELNISPIKRPDNYRG
ncbi:hypothetical protein NVP1198B_53 [Vibrio phage 1.198.B._10N.286.54.F4]|nr:hypothetical protein NVP1198A_54 [Vibrio phage 1.198.A._10N.286.54.F4]AUR94841.1 hypothetical protein NVP1198B_53 [Vibrio phage 1.198.B._10N.286.54.F4]